MYFPKMGHFPKLRSIVFFVCKLDLSSSNLDRTVWVDKISERRTFHLCCNAITNWGSSRKRFHQKGTNQKSFGHIALKLCAQPLVEFPSQ